MYKRAKLDLRSTKKNMLPLAIQAWSWSKHAAKVLKLRVKLFWKMLAALFGCHNTCCESIEMIEIL